MDTQPSSQVAHAVALGATMVATLALMHAGSKRPGGGATPAGPGRGAPGRKRAKKTSKDPTKYSFAGLLEESGVEDPDSRASKRFRKAFRVPHAIFMKLVLIASSMEHCAKMNRKDACGRGRHPVEM